uniref:BURP domain-containing protein n=1 Tax=Setaria digitata TaxID=48799 RepID=A0A915Q103_9BILA
MGIDEVYNTETEEAKIMPHAVCTLKTSVDEHVSNQNDDSVAHCALFSVPHSLAGNRSD